MRGSITLGRPNEVQSVPLSWVVPSPSNPRLFIELEPLEELEARYRSWLDNPAVVLPDPPIVRFQDWDSPLGLLGGHRRLRAAASAGVESLPMRIVQMDDQDAYLFLIAANHHEGITTVERAFKAAEMERLGFSREEISEALRGVNPHRYVLVGQLLHPDLFTDLPKLCDPNITAWYEAARYGQEHFLYCFKNWDSGLWDEETCRKKFRRRGQAAPIDNAERGIRLSTTKDGRSLILRGRIPLDMYTDEELYTLFAERLPEDLRRSIINGIHNREQDGFGRRVVALYNADTLEA